MAEFSQHGRGHSFYPPEQGKAFPTYDISGAEQRVRDLYDLLNKHVQLLTRQLTDEARRMLNNESVGVRCNEWMMIGADAADIQVRAFPAEKKDASVVLATDRKSIFGLSELFFGGDPEKVTERQVEKRDLTDTERRLLSRLLEMILANISPLLGYDVNHWQARWPDPDQPLPENCCWTELTLVAGSWQGTLNLGWPTELGRLLPGEKLPEAAQFREGLVEALRTVATQLTVEIGSLEIPVGDIENLKPGDILPLNLAEETVARALDKECLAGTVCEHGDELAFRITRHLGATNE